MKKFKLVLSTWVAIILCGSSVECVGGRFAENQP